MLSAGFKFICCSQEEDEESPSIVWTTNILSLENIKAHKERIRYKVCSTNHSVNYENSVVYTAPSHHDNQHRRIKSYGEGLIALKEKHSTGFSFCSPRGRKSSIVHSLKVLSRGSRIRICDLV